MEQSTGGWSDRKTPQLGSPIFKVFEQSVGKLIGVNYTQRWSHLFEQLKAYL